MSDAPISPLAAALGRMPTGLYIVSTLKDGRPLGFVGSFLIQTGLEPPRLCVAVGKGRDHLEAMRESGHFAVSILDGASAGLMGTFFKPAPEGQTHFDLLETLETPSGIPVLAASLAWLDCKVCGEFNGGDHIVVFGEICAGEQLHEGEPSVHLRKNGLSY